MRHEIIAGLDIGSSNIHAVIAGFHPETEKLEILAGFACPSKGVRKGAVVDPQDATSAIKDILKTVEKRAVLKVREAFCGISGSHIEAKPGKGVIAISRADGEVSEEDVERVIEAAATFSLPQNREILHNLPQDFSVDKETGVENPVGMKGVRLEVNTLIIEAFKPFVKNLTQCLKDANIENLGFVFAPIAAATACLSKRQKELGVLLLDIGGASTSLAVYEEGVLRHAAVIPLGSGHITNDLAIGLKIPIEAAEEIKLKYGAASAKTLKTSEKIDLSKIEGGLLQDEKIERAEIIKIVEARVREIMAFVNKELKKIERERMLPAGIVLAGGGAKLSNLIDAVKTELNLPCQLGYPLDVEGLIDEVNSPEFATTVGLIKWSRHLQKIKRSSQRKKASALTNRYLGGIKEFLRNLIP